jgi:hypothetical protein
MPRFEPVEVRNDVESKVVHRINGGGTEQHTRGLVADLKQRGILGLKRRE